MESSVLINNSNNLKTNKIFERSYIQSIDGLRALSIFLVLIGHLELIYGIPNFLGTIGVHIFFCISGFLITGLLLKEQIKNSKISLKKFYVRRILRIFPAFYLYLIISYFLLKLYQIPVSIHDYIYSYLYVKNFFFGHTWFVMHIWSLSVEEQFYLLWPLLIKKNKYLLFLFFSIILYPFLQVYVYKYGSSPVRYLQPFFSEIPAIMFGSLLSISLFKNWLAGYETIIKRPLFLLSIFIATLTYLPKYFLKFGFFSIPFSYIISSFCITIFLFHLISVSHTSIVYKVFNNTVTKFIGKISYSLYIWQQSFSCSKGREKWRSSSLEFISYEYNSVFGSSYSFLSLCREAHS